MVNLFIGTKPSSIYTEHYVALVEQGFNSITLKARGRAINQAVNVLELLRNRILIGEVSVEDVTFYTDSMKIEGQIPVRVSVIAIKTKVLKK